MTNDQIQSILGAKTVSFNAVFAKATGSVTAAVFLSQAIFWQEKAKFKTDLLDVDGEKYFSKTASEWYEETGLSTDQQKTARVPLIKAGILKEKRAGLPAKMYFRVDIEALVSGIAAYLNTGNRVSGFAVNKGAENPRTVNGKYRKQEDGKPESNIESFESFESEEERKISSSASKPENHSLEEEKKENDLHRGAPDCPDKTTPGVDTKWMHPQTLEPPFTHVGTIEPAPAILARLYSPEHPDISIVTSVPGTYTANTEFRRVNIPEEIERLKTDPAAKETFALVRKIPSNLYPDYVEAFEKEIGGTGETYHNLPAFRKHFFNWCGSRYEIAQRKTNTHKTNRSQINHAGGNPDKYLEKQIF